MNASLDPRVNPYRPDLAAASMRGKVEAPLFVEGKLHQVRAARVTVRRDPTETARQTSELLFGERFTVYDTRDGWAWGQGEADGYVGWTRAEALTAELLAPTHRVAALHSHIYPEPDLKTHALTIVHMNSPVTVTEERNGWAALATGGWIFTRHLAPVATTFPDHVETALRFMGLPYVWGGRSSQGIDCSGLVQISLLMAGIPTQRDSDLQRATIGTLVSQDGNGVTYRRGDIVGFPGHVGIMLDETRLLHATAYTMSVCIEPLADVATRAGGILAVRRL